MSKKELLGDVSRPQEAKSVSLVCPWDLESQGSRKFMVLNSGGKKEDPSPLKPLFPYLK